MSSQTGFESIGYGAAGEFLSFTTTIANNTESDLSVRRGGASIDGHVAFPLSVVPTNRATQARAHTSVGTYQNDLLFESVFLRTKIPLSEQFLKSLYSPCKERIESILYHSRPSKISLPLFY